MKKLTIFLLAILACNCTFADVPPANVNAVVKVTTHDNKVVEGVIELIQNSYEGTHVNAFYFEDTYTYGNVYSPCVCKHSLRLPFFTIEDNECGVGGISFSTVLGDTGMVPAPTPKYMKFEKYSNNVEYVKSGDTLSVSNTYSNKYILSDYFEMDATLVFDEFYTTKKTILKIKMSEIKSIELVENPAQKWLDTIAEFSKAYEKMLDEGTGDGNVPVWYHDIKKDIELFNFYENLLIHSK